MASRRFDTAAADKPATALADRTGLTSAPDLSSALTPAQPWGPPAHATTEVGVLSPEVQAAARDWASGRPVSPIESPTGSFLLAVQRRYGNQFAQRLVQPAGGRRPPGAVPTLQPLLRAGAPGDRYERQADLVARRVAGRGPGRGSADHDAGPDAGRRDRGEGGEAKASPGLETSIRHPAGGGRPLASTAARPMEQAFGADFTRVRVHSDVGADDLCRRIGARAFTVGEHIFFRRGEQPSGGGSGQHLLAHELTHVVQQRGAVPPGGDARPASTASAPRETIQAFWVKRYGKYYWRQQVKRRGKWIKPADDQAKFVELEGETHSGKTRSGKKPKGPVYVEQWEAPGTKLAIEPEIEKDIEARIKKKSESELEEEFSASGLKADVIEDLRQIRRTGVGSRLLQSLAARSPRRTVIKPSPGGPDPETTYLTTGESHIRFAPRDVYDAWNWLADNRNRENVRWRTMPRDVVLFHELVHAYHNAYGTTAEGELDSHEALNPVDIRVKLSEYQAVGLDTKDGEHKFSREPFTENKYRKARKLPRRTTYKVPYNPGVQAPRRWSLEQDEGREDDE
jgi:hypothetical protein